MTSWDQVGGNPCPGDLGALRSDVRALQSVRDHGRDLANRLADLHDGMGTLRWTGAGSQSITGLVEKALPDLRAFWTAHDHASSALATFTDRLEELQAQAAGALGDYSTAVDALAGADKSLAEASNRFSAAVSQLGVIDREIHDQTMQRQVAVMTQQPTTAFDQEIAHLSGQRGYQASLKTQAQSDVASAKIYVADAADRKMVAQRKVDSLRHELTDYGRTAATLILASVGIVRSSNPFIRALQDSAAAVDDWLYDHVDEILEEWDELLSVVCLVAIFVPGLDLVIGAIALVSLLGHIYRLANGKGDWKQLALPIMTLAGVGSARILKALSDSPPEAFDSVLGIVKRFRYPANAQHAEGWLSSGGIRVLGNFRYHVYVGPRQVRGSVEVYRSLLFVKAFTQTVEYGHLTMEFGGESLKELKRVVDGGQSGGSYLPMIGLQFPPSGMAQGSASMVQN